jgi:hypothetical protein
MPSTIAEHVSINVDTYSSLALVTHPIMQSFTTPMGGPHAIESIVLPLRRVGTCTVVGNVNVGIYAVDENGWPTGDALSTGSVAANTLSAASITPYGLRATFNRTITLSAYSLTGSTTYAIQLSLDAYDAGYPQQYVQWLALDEWTYAGGKPARYRTGWAPDGWEDYPTTADLEFQVMGPVTVSKPTTPSPANGATAVDFSALTLGWAEGGSGTTMYSVFMGPAADDLWLVENVTAPTASLTVSLDDVPLGQVVYWRVDATDGVDTVTGDVWSFDPRPAKVTNPTPASPAIGQSLNVGSSWDAAAGATSYDCYLVAHGSPTVLRASDLTGVQIAALSQYLTLAHGTQYDWRIDAKNQFGTTTGDVWSFATLDLDPPLPSWTGTPGPMPSWSIVDGELVLTLAGVEGVDFVWNGINNMRTTRRLVAAAKNRIWYEGA